MQPPGRRQQERGELVEVVGIGSPRLETTLRPGCRDSRDRGHSPRQWRGWHVAALGSPGTRAFLQHEAGAVGGL